MFIEVIFAIFYSISLFIVLRRFVTKDVKPGVLTMLIVATPVINTIFAIIYLIIERHKIKATLTNHVKSVLSSLSKTFTENG